VEYLPRLAKLKTTGGAWPKNSGAIKYFNQALSINPTLPLLSRGVARYQLLDRSGAIQDAKLLKNSFSPNK